MGSNQSISSSMQENIFSLWAVQCWNRFSKGAVEFPSLEVLKVLLDKALAAALSFKGVKQMTPRGPIQILE